MIFKKRLTVSLHIKRIDYKYNFQNLTFWDISKDIIQIYLQFWLHIKHNCAFVISCLCFSGIPRYATNRDSHFQHWLAGSRENFVLHWIVRWRFRALDSSSSGRWAEACRFQMTAHLEKVSGTASVSEGPSVLPGTLRRADMSAIYILFCSDSRATVSKILMFCVSARTLSW